MLLSFLIIACASSANSKKEPFLLASREAPLGYVTVQLFSDNSFEFINGSIRSAYSKSYSGTFQTIGDTLIFSYAGSVPGNGCDRAIRTERFLVFEGCLGSLEIQKNDSGDR